MARRRTLGGPPPLVLQALLLLRVADVAARAAVTPVTKVLDLLDGLLSTGKAEKHDEEVRFAAFRTWCDSVKEERTRSIDVATKALVQHEADAGSAQADADNLGAEAGELDEQMNGWEGERAKASELRKASRAEFSAADADYAESIDAIRRAIAALKSRSADVPQALLQAGAAARLSATDRQSVLSAAAASRQAPEANAYESQSGGVVGLLENLLEKFVEERRKLQVEETNRRHAHELLDQRLTDNLRQAKKAREQKVEMKASRLQDLAAAKADIKATSEAKTADETYLRDTLGACAQKSEDFERRQRLRSEELEALKQAREIIASPEVAGAANTHLPAAAAAASAASSLAQLRANAQEEPLQRSVAALLLRRSELSGSQLLAAAAGRVGEDPMAKVKQMLKDLIARLLEEAGDEADHKAWCDKELGENGETRDQKSTEVSELTARAEELTAQEAKLAQEAATLATELEELRTSVAEATKARSEESKKNAATEAEAKQVWHISTSRARGGAGRDGGHARAQGVLQEGGHRHGLHSGSPGRSAGRCARHLRQCLPGHAGLEGRCHGHAGGSAI
eukprot:TRINITY_DN12490_c0_g1_i1.p1 TRINITY_DN12490_c0_g1~~TRINITY_DN12490_c0_g1_i1.p1  ORF type:complete len:572 (+),score=163.63 TRINITY_DN12490_c0_g1_i1:93-1808(+)